MTEDDSFQADGKPEGVLYGFLTKGANISIGGGFRGQTLGVEAGCDSGPAINAAAINNNDAAVIVANNGGGPGFFCPGLKVSSFHGEGVFASGASNGVHGTSESQTDSGLFGENGNNGFGVTGSSTVVGIGIRGEFDKKGTTLEGHPRPPGGVGVWGTAVVTAEPVGDGVLGEGVNGIHGRSKSPTDSGVYGENTGGGTGVGGLTNGESGPKGAVAGVWGVNQGAGAGVRGTGGKTGVLGECNGHLGSNGVHGFGAAEGTGVRGTGGVYGVLGEGPVGVRGESSVRGSLFPSIGVLAESTASGIGLRANASGGTGVSASGGLGGVFEGTIALLQLIPSQTAGHPTSGQHSMGELYVDVQGVLWFCIASARP